MVMIDTILSHDGVGRRRFWRNLVGLALSLPLMPGCVGPGSTEVTRARQRRNIEAAFDTTLARCYLAAPSSRELVSGAVGVLVFPTVALINPVTSEWAGVGALRGATAARSRNRTVATRQTIPPPRFQIGRS